jgi:prophage DNA circulation protein
MGYWRDSLRPGSFRGVPFETVAGERELGRRVAVHEYVNRDDVESDDLGRKPRTFSIEAYVIGADYMSGRDALDAALDQVGTGILIHPWHGQKTVRLVKATSSESTREGGMARYQLEFIEEGVVKTPSQTVDSQAAVTTSADSLRTAATADFVSRFSVANRPDFVRDAAAGILGKFSDSLDKVTSGLKGFGSPLDSFVNQGLALRHDVFDLLTRPADLSAAIAGLFRGITQIVNTPADVAGTLSGLFGGSSSGSGSDGGTGGVATATASAVVFTSTPQDAVSVLSVMMDFGSDLPAVDPITPSRQAQSDNQEALVGLIQCLAAAEAVTAIAGITFTSYDDAVAARDDIADRLDVIALGMADAFQDVPARAVEDARTAIIRDVTARGGSLAHLYTYTPLVTLPALVLAHSLYDDTGDIEGRAAEIVARNKIAHPGFVRGGSQLEVLTDG